MLLDLIDREMKSEFNVVLNTERDRRGGLTVKMLSTQAGDLPLIPEWSLELHRHARLRLGGAAGLHRHRGPDRVPLAGRSELRASSSSASAGSLASQYVVVKFGGVVVKGANYAHYQVLVDR